MGQMDPEREQEHVSKTTDSSRATQYVFSALSTRDGDERKGGGERGREMEREIGVKEV